MSGKHKVREFFVTPKNKENEFDLLIELFYLQTGQKDWDTQVQDHQKNLFDSQKCQTLFLPELPFMWLNPFCPIMPEIHSEHFIQQR